MAENSNNTEEARRRQANAAAPSEPIAATLEDDFGTAVADDALAQPMRDDATPSDVSAANSFGHLTVAIIDDACHPPRLDRLSDGDAAKVADLLSKSEEIAKELSDLGCDPDASPDEKLLKISEQDSVILSDVPLAETSADAKRMVEEHRSFRRLHALLEDEIGEVTICDPYADLPDLSRHNLILLDYYLNGPAGGGELAVSTANSIRSQEGRADDQQIVLMSSIERVRDLRGEFRREAGIAGGAFAFIDKPDLNESWKIKAHLGMLGRARPYASAFSDYRTHMEEALVDARTGLLEMVDDLDIGDYAFLQSRALMKDGHPLGDYVFWLLSSQLLALSFERETMRERQRKLDGLEFVGAPFAATEPSTVVANLLHSALVTRNTGPLGPHPRAMEGTPYADVPLIQLGDVFTDQNRTKAWVVMTADCDLAFSTVEERKPDVETPVMLVPGKPVKQQEAKSAADVATEGLVHREEVYRIVWDFKKWRSVPLGRLQEWLVGEGLDVSNRDRLRPLFALKLQQEFGAHLMRVGNPTMPPTTSAVRGRVFVCLSEREETIVLDADELHLTRLGSTAWLRITTKVASLLKEQCVDLLARLEEQADSEKGRAKENTESKAKMVQDRLDDDAFWIELLEPIVLNKPGSIFTKDPLGIVFGSEWTVRKPCVVLEVDEKQSVRRSTDGSGDGQPENAPELSTGEAVSTAA